MKFKKRNRKKRSIFELIKHWIKPLSILSILLLAGFSWHYYNFDSLLKVSIKWEIDSPNLVNQASLEQQIKPLINGLHQLNLHAIKKKLENHPWVLNAHVKRLFWDKISIKISTHQIATVWKNTHDIENNIQGYLTTQGVIITPKNLFYHQQNHRFDKIQSAYTSLEKSQQLLTDYHAYQQILTPLKIDTFIRSNVDSLIIFPNITVILGYDKQTLRLKKFVKIYTKLATKIPLNKLKNATYDMRYSKGFALKLIDSTTPN